MSQSAIEVLVTIILAICVLFPFTSIVDLILRKKYTAMGKAWDSMLDLCKSQADTATCASWLGRQRTAVLSGKLTFERAASLAEAGFIAACPKADSLPSAEAEKDRFRFNPGVLERIAYCALASAFPLALIALDAAFPVFMVGCLISTILAIIVACDMKARIIPYQSCIVFAAAALCWVVLTRPESIVSSIILALASYLVITGTEKIAIQFTSASAIGAGDRRLIPLICFLIGPQGLLFGLIGLCVVALAMAINALIHGKPKRSYLPFAPALMAFAVAGAVYPLSPLSGVLL